MHFRFLIAALWTVCLCPSVLAEKIVVYGKRDRALAKPGAAEISGTQLRVDFGAGSMEKALSSSPAVQVLPGSEQAGAPRFLVRGQDSVENRYFLAGFPLSNARLNQPDLELLSTHFFDSLDLYAGGIPVHFGEDGLGGAINFGLFPWEAASRLGVRGGAFGALAAFADVRSGESIRLGLEYSQASEDFLYYDDNGTPLNLSDDSFRRRAHNGMRRYLFFPRVRLLATKRHQIELLSWHSGVFRELPGPTRGLAGGETREAFQLTGLRSQWDVSQNLTLETHAYARTNFEELNGIAPFVGSAAQSFEAGHLSVGVRSHARYWPLNTDFVLGGAWEKYHIRSVNASETGEQQRVQIPLALSSKIRPRAGVELQPAFQAHFYDYTASGTGVFGNSGQSALGLTARYLLLSPRLGTEVHLSPGWRWRTLVGHFYRAPSLFELFGSPTGVSPSPSLKYERALKAEAGLDFSREWTGTVEKLKVSYTFSYQHARDLITYVQNSQNSSVATNIGASRIFSQELSVDVETSLGLGASANAVWMDSDNLSRVSYETGKDLPLRPDWRAHLATRYRTGNLELGYQLSWAGPSYGDSANLRRLAGALFHGAYVSLRTRDYGDFHLEGRNLGDATTAASTYQNTDVETLDYTTGFPGYPAPGRRIYLSWTLTL